MPAMAVKRMTKAAMMYWPRTGEMVGKMRWRMSPPPMNWYAGDGGVGEEDGDDAEDAGGLVVAGLEEVWDGELGELAGARGDEVDEQEAGPAAGGLPERGEAVFVGVFGAAEEGARADPGTEQGEDEDEGGQGAAGDEVVGLGLDLGDAGERDGEEGEYDDGEDDGVKVHG